MVILICRYACNLTKDPELRSTGSGMSVCQLRVAVNSRRKDQNGEWVDKPNYFDVTVFGAQGENCANYLAKGRPVAVEGRLDFSEWEAKDGSGKRNKVEIIANDLGNRIMPSYVAFSDGERLIGEAAKNQATVNPENRRPAMRNPAPSGPRWRTRPHGASSAAASATSSASPPAMIDSVPARAPVSPPDTGQSTTRTRPALAASRRSARARSGSRVPTGSWCEAM